MPTVEEWVEGYRSAWETRDAEAAASLFTEDASYRSNIFEEAHLGRDGVRNYWAGVTSGQSEVAVKMGRPISEGDRTMVEWWTTMNVEGSPTTLTGCLILKFDESGLCSDLREYWQVGEGSLMPPPGWGE